MGYKIYLYFHQFNPNQSRKLEGLGNGCQKNIKNYVWAFGKSSKASISTFQLLLDTTKKRGEG